MRPAGFPYRARTGKIPETLLEAGRLNGGRCGASGAITGGRMSDGGSGGATLRAADPTERAGGGFAGHGFAAFGQRV